MEKIFSCGYILPYKDIVRIYGNVISRKNCITLNGMDYILISLHESNPQKIDIEYEIKNAWLWKCFSKFYYTRPSIVLETSIANDLKFLNYNGIYLERLVVEPIWIWYFFVILILCWLLSIFLILLFRCLFKYIDKLLKIWYYIIVKLIINLLFYEENEVYIYD